MRTNIYWIWPGRLAIASRPRGGDWLQDEISAWRVAGVDIIVSALTPEERAELDLEEEEAQCRIAGLGFHSAPIPDRGLPLSRATIAELVLELKRDLDAGKSVLVHCRQGIGRSSMIAAVLLIASGVEPERALTAIESARGQPVPDTPEQREWVLDWR